MLTSVPKTQPQGHRPIYLLNIWMAAIASALAKVEDGQGNMLYLDQTTGRLWLVYDAADAPDDARFVTLMDGSSAERMAARLAHIARR